MTRIAKMTLVGAVAIIVVLVVIAIGFPILLRSRIRRNEAFALGSLRRIVAVESAYAKSHPRQGYVCGLFPSAGGGGMPDEIVPIREIFKQSSKYYYNFEFDNCSAVGYRIVANPLYPGPIAPYTFCSDQTGVIRFEPSPSKCGEKSPVWAGDRP